MSDKDLQKKREYKRYYNSLPKTKLCKKRWRDKHNKEIKIKARLFRKQNKDKINTEMRKWWHEHHEAQLLRSKIYRDKYPEKARLRKFLWRKNNREKYHQSNANYYKNNIIARLANGLRARVILAIKAQNNRKNSHLTDLIGCDISELRLHLEKQFQDGMDWKNWGRADSIKKTWHIDHKIPCISFNLSDVQEQKKCFHYSNLQPLWSFDNLSKGCKKIK